MWEELVGQLKFWLPLIIGSSVLAAFIAFALEWSRSSFKERDDHNKRIVSIYNELKIIRKNLEERDFGYNDGIEKTNIRILLPTSNMNYLIPKIAGSIRSETLNNLEQICIDISEMKTSAFRVRLNIKDEIGKIDHALEDLRKEIKWMIPNKPKLN